MGFVLQFQVIIDSRYVLRAKVGMGKGEGIWIRWWKGGDGESTIQGGCRETHDSVVFNLRKEVAAQPAAATACLGRPSGRSVTPGCLYSVRQEQAVGAPCGYAAKLLRVVFQNFYHPQQPHCSLSQYCTEYGVHTLRKRCRPFIWSTLVLFSPDHGVQLLCTLALKTKRQMDSVVKPAPI